MYRIYQTENKNVTEIKVKRRFTDIEIEFRLSISKLSYIFISLIPEGISNTSNKL